MLQALPSANRLFSVTHVLTQSAMMACGRANRSAEIDNDDGSKMPSLRQLPAIVTTGIVESLDGSARGSLLSPLSSEDLCAQPLSPATLAFFQTVQHNLHEAQASPLGEVSVLTIQGMVGKVLLT